jgi:hypothetical protein
VELEMTRIVEKVRLLEKSDALWEKIGRFGAVGEWHPMLFRVRSEGEREGSVRTAEARDGTHQTERLIEAAPERRSYRYRMEKSVMLVHDYVAELRVHDNRDGTSTVIWLAQFEPIADEGHTAEGVRRFFKAGLDNLEKIYGKVA